MGMLAGALQGPPLDMEAGKRSERLIALLSGANFEWGSEAPKEDDFGAEFADCTTAPALDAILDALSQRVLTSAELDRLTFLAKAGLLDGILEEPEEDQADSWCPQKEARIRRLQAVVASLEDALADAERRGGLVRRNLACLPAAAPSKGQAARGCAEGTADGADPLPEAAPPSSEAAQKVLARAICLWQESLHASHLSDALERLCLTSEKVIAAVDACYNLIFSPIVDESNPWRTVSSAVAERRPAHASHVAHYQALIGAASKVIIASNVGVTEADFLKDLLADSRSLERLLQDHQATTLQRLLHIEEAHAGTLALVQGCLKAHQGSMATVAAQLEAHLHLTRSTLGALEELAGSVDKLEEEEATAKSSSTDVAQGAHRCKGHEAFTKSCLGLARRWLESAITLKEATVKLIEPLIDEPLADEPPIDEPLVDRPGGCKALVLPREATSLEASLRSASLEMSQILQRLSSQWDQLAAQIGHAGRDENPFI